MSDYTERAVDALVDDFGLAKEWLWEQFEENGAAFVHSLAEALGSPARAASCEDAGAIEFTRMREYFREWIVRDETRVQRKADQLREADEEDFDEPLEYEPTSRDYDRAQDAYERFHGW